MKSLKLFLGRISITDYSISGICLLFLGYYQFTEPNLKFVKADYEPFAIVSFNMPYAHSYGLIQSYRFLFKNKSVKHGHVSRIETFMDSINVTKTEINSCWINKIKISPFGDEVIQIDIAITSKDSSIMSLTNKNTFKIIFYDNYNNLIEFDGTNFKAEQKLRFNSYTNEAIQRQTQKSLYNPLQGSEYYYK